MIPGSKPGEETPMAKSRIKSGGPTSGRFKERRIGMNSGKVLAKGRIKKRRRGK